MRARSLLPAATLCLSSCAVTAAPQLAPTAAGCYAVELDALPAEVPFVMVPPLPERLVLDTAFGGQVHVPVSWLAAQGIGMRQATLGLLRPEWTIRAGRVVIDRARSRPLPPDSIVLGFAGGAAASVTALIGTEAGGDWRGWAFAPQSSVTPSGPPLVPFRLRRTVCDQTSMALSR